MIMFYELDAKYDFTHDDQSCPIQYNEEDPRVFCALNNDVVWTLFEDEGFLFVKHGLHEDFNTVAYLISDIEPD